MAKHTRRIFAHGVTPNSRALLPVFRGQDAQEGRVIRVDPWSVTVDWGHYRDIYYYRRPRGDRPGEWRERSSMGGHLFPSRVRFESNVLADFVQGLVRAK